MLALLKSIRFTIVASLYLIAPGTIALPAAGNASSDQSSARFSTVLAPGQEPREGLTSLFTVPNGIYGSYELNGKIVYFETRRGPRTPKFLRDGDPATPQFEIDVRFMDQDGEPFLIQIGGDAPFDHTWTETTTKFKTDTQAKTEFELAAKTIETLKKLKFTHKFVHERQALLNLATIMDSAQVIEKIEVAPNQALSAPSLLDANMYQHRVEIHDKRCCFGLGRHSATIGKYISSGGVTTTAVITCNHGTCANQMALKCSWTSASPGNRTNDVKNGVTCTTPYNPTSVFGHNSNDDTYKQYRAVRYDFHPNPTGGKCNNSSVNNNPTSCY
ncbi:MAG: hypothetical protein ACXW06_08275 [Halobacteriota archaeon]